MNKIALLTYSTKPRGGVSHTLSLAESLDGLGLDVHVFALATGKDFFRPVSVPYTLIPCPDIDYKNMDEKVKSYIEIYTQYLAQTGNEYEIFHAEDCISANALYNLRLEGLIEKYVRTIHHIDDFTSEALIECQLKSVVEPDYLIAVSRLWQKELKATYDIDSVVINNGVTLRGGGDLPSDQDKKRAKKSFGVEDTDVLLSIGGIEPRKNTLTTLRAFYRARAALKKRGRRLVWLIGGGETLFDYRDYRDEFFSEVSALGLELDRDIQVLGSVPEEKMGELYNSADVFVFPSVKEGWGLVALEAMGAGVPVIASGIEPMTEYLSDRENAILISPMDFQAMSGGIIELQENGGLRSTLIENGSKTAAEYSWGSAAEKHEAFYSEILKETKRVNKKAVGDD